MARRDVGMAEPLAHHRGVLALDQGVVVAVAGPALGELPDVQLVQQCGHPVVDVLTAVIGMKAVDGEGKGFEQFFEHRHQEALGDGGDGADVLELGDLVDDVEVIDALEAVLVTLVHGIDAHEAGSPLWIRSAAGADGYRGGACGFDHPAHVAVGAGLAQVVQVAVGELGKALEAGIAEDLPLAAQQRAGGGPGHLAQGRIDLGQQADVGRRVAALEWPGRRPAPVLDTSALAVLGDQARQLRPRQPRHLLQVALHCALVRLAQAGIVQAHQGAPHQRIEPFAIAADEVDRLAACHKGAHLLQGAHPFRL